MPCPNKTKMKIDLDKFIQDFKAAKFEKIEDLEFLRAYAEPFTAKEFSKDTLIKDFKDGTYTTAIKQVIKISYNKIMSKLDRGNARKEDRTAYIGLIKPTFDNPLFVVEMNNNKNEIRYYKPYIDPKDNLVHLMAISVDKGSGDYLQTVFDADFNKLNETVKGEIIYPKKSGRETTTNPPQKDNSNSQHTKADNMGTTRIDFSIHSILAAFKKNVNEIKQSNNKVDLTVDKLWNGFFNALEIVVQPLKNLLDLRIKGAKDSNWFYISENTRQANEILNNFRIIKSNVYENAGNIKQGLETLSKEDNKNLVKALNGDLDPNELNPNTKRLHDSFRAIIDKNADELINVGILDEKDKIEAYLKRYYSQYVDENAKKTGGSVAFNKLKARKDLTYDERIALGMIEDATFVIPNTIAEQNILIEKGRVLKALADAFGHDEEIAGYVKISDESAKSGLKKYGDLAGKWVHPDIKKELDYARIVQKEFHWVEDGIYPLIDHLKVNLTVKNPTTHVYNIASNMLLAGLNGDMLSLGKVLYLRYKRPNKFKELVKQANSLGLNSYLDDFENSHVELEPNGRVNVAQTIWKNLYMTRDSKIGKSIRYLYDWEDKIFKIASFYKGLENGLDAKTAFNASKSVYVDYSTPLPAFIRVVDKSGLMPFLHYQFKSTPEVAKVMLKNPIRTLVLGTGLFALDGLVFQNEEEENYKPDWAGNKRNLFWAKEWLRVGNGYYLNAGRMIPGTKFDFEFGGILFDTIGIVNGISPLGYKIGSDYDTDWENYSKRVLAMAENYLPSMTLGRYMIRGSNIALGEMGITEPKKNYYNEDMTMGELTSRAFGVRRFNEERELNSKMKKAKNEYKREVKSNPESKKEQERIYDNKSKEIIDAGRKINKDIKKIPLKKEKDFNFEAKFKF